MPRFSGEVSQVTSKKRIRIKKKKKRVNSASINRKIEMKNESLDQAMVVDQEQSEVNVSVAEIAPAKPKLRPQTGKHRKQRAQQFEVNSAISPPILMFNPKDMSPKKKAKSPR